MHRTLTAMVLGASLAWAAAPALATSHQPATPPAVQSPAPAVQNPTAATQTPAPAPKGAEMKSKAKAHPTMQVVIKDLEQARVTLQKETTPDGEGHRVKAIQALDQALRELRMAVLTPTK